MPQVDLSPYNTITITASQGVYRLVGAQGMPRMMDILNLGPGAVYLRDDRDPVIADERSQILPANWALSGLSVNGRQGLGVVADADTRLSVRVL